MMFTDLIKYDAIKFLMGVWIEDKSEDKLNENDINMCRYSGEETNKFMRDQVYALYKHTSKS